LTFALCLLTCSQFFSLARPLAVATDLERIARNWFD